MKLLDKVVLVTGGSSGIGAAIARRFAAEGASVVVAFDKNIEGAKNVVHQISNFGQNASYMQADLRRENDIRILFDKIDETYGRLDILINNAGRTYGVPFSQITKESIIRDLETNLISVMLCAKYAVPLMHGKGWIVNTASIRGLPESGRKGIMGYCAAKAGVVSFTKSLAVELAPGICVNAVAPGFVRTPYFDSGISEDLKEKWCTNTPMKQFVDINELVEIYLLLSTSRAMTGTVIVADGGYTILDR